jgi:hypothetical protein
MTIVIPKNASKEEIKKAIAGFEKKRKKKKSVKGKGNISKLFGSNPSEIDGLKFQKKIRREWD